jgi:hypothetical protein
MKKFLIILVAIFFNTLIVHAAELSVPLYFEEPFIRNNKIESQCWATLMQPGAPQIPFYSAYILLPFGEKISSVQINHSEWEKIGEDIFIDYARTPQPISQSSLTPSAPDRSIYNSNLPFPANEYEYLFTQMYAGYSIAVINIFPFRYTPSSGKVYYADEWDLTIQSTYDPELAEYQGKMLCETAQIHKRLEKMVENPEQIFSYRGKKSRAFPRTTLVNPDEPYEYIIITSNDFEPTFDAFFIWKASQGIEIEIFSIEDIYDQYDGNDNANKLRSFIIDAYQTWSSSNSPLQYVLLGGDDEIIPVRKFFVQAGGETGYIPSDLYFSALDGTFDANNNGIYGEYPADSIDFFPEIAIGRIPGDTEQDFVNALNKIEQYATVPKPALEKACMVGERLDNIPTWGGDYKDDVLTRFPEENYHVTTLYQRDGTYSDDAIFNAIADGTGILNHMGHANYFILMGMSPDTPDQMTNNEYGLIYTQGCYPAAFDEATSGPREAVGERLVIAPSGPMAFIGNTRYGWYMPGSIEGPSQQFDRTFFYGLFTENIRTLGDCINYSKTSLIAQVDNPYIRWCYYELILFGDPQTEIIVLDGEFPYLVPEEIIYIDEIGDGDGIINPGETIEIVLTLANLPEWQPAYDITVLMSYQGNQITLIDSCSTFPDIFPEGIATNATDPFVFQVSEDCGYESIEYQLVVTANTDTDYPFEKVYICSLDISLTLPGWPVYLGYEVKSSPVVVDFDNDGEKEIITVDAGGNLYPFESDASLTTGFPIELEESVWASHAVGDIDNDQQLEIVITTRAGKIYAIDNDGSTIFAYQTDNQMICTPSLADMNNDGNLEIIAPGVDGRLYVVNHDGSDFPNFPYYVGTTLCSDAAIGDINSDGIQDILVGDTDGILYAISTSGELLEGFPIETEYAIWSSPVIYGEDNPYIAWASGSCTYIADGYGDIKNTIEVSGTISSPLSVFTFDDNLYLAFITDNGVLGIIDTNGNLLQGWPIETGFSTKNSLAIVDLNNDGILDILFSALDGKIIGYTIYADMLPEFPISIGFLSHSPVTIDDFDMDGDFEIIVGNGTGIFVCDYKIAKGEQVPWPMFRGNMQRTGNYQDNTIAGINSPPEGAQTPILSQNFPNPFSTSTKISFNIHHGDTENAEIKIYNIKGQLIRQFKIQNSKFKISGEAIWDGRDSSGKPVPSGVYLYRLTTDSFTSETKKMILIR